MAGSETAKNKVFNLVANELGAGDWKRLGRNLDLTTNELDELDIKGLLMGGRVNKCVEMLEKWIQKKKPEEKQIIPILIRELEDIHRKDIADAIGQYYESNIGEETNLDFKMFGRYFVKDEMVLKIVSKIQEIRFKVHNDNKEKTGITNAKSTDEMDAELIHRDRKRGRLTYKFWFISIIGGIILISSFICIIYFWYASGFEPEFTAYLLLWVPFVVGYFTFLVRYYSDEKKPCRMVLFEVLGDVGCYKSKNKGNNENHA